MTRLDFFYLIKPLIPRRLQLALRRARVRYKLKRCRNVWPILEVAGTKPAGWRGWPEGKKFAFVLTHDVEGPRGRDRCLQLAAVEEEFGFRSSFNFVPRDYETSKELRDELTRRGHEVGIHGLEHDGKLFRTWDGFLHKAKQINEYIREWDAPGFRAPAMHHNLHWLSKLDIEYDASTFDVDPFEPQPHGEETIFPFIVSPNGGPRSYVELPYSLVQDFTLFVIMQEPNITMWTKKLDWIAERGGMALLDSHPDYMCFNGPKGKEEYPVALYRTFLEYVKTRHAGEYWHVVPRQLARHVRSHPEEVPVRTLRHVCMMAYAFYDTDNRIIRYAETLAARGDSVDVIALRRPGQPERDTVNGVRVFRVQERERNEGMAATYLFRMLKFFIKSSRMLAKLNKAYAYDVVHVHSVPDFQVFATWPVKRLGTHVILDIHDIVPEFYASKFNVGPTSLLFKLLVLVERWSTKFADHVIIANHIWQKRLVERSVSPEKCRVVLNYVDTDRFRRREHRRQDGRFVAVYPGGLQWHQGLDIAIRAFGRLKTAMPEAELHIYGDGSERDHLAKLVDELDLGKTVFIHPMVPHQEVASVIAEADLGIVPKRADSFGNEAYSTKILEFMSQGIPVIASKTMIDTYYFQEPALRFFESGNDEDLANKIMEIARDEKLRRTMLEAADNYFVSNSWSARQKEYLDLVDRLAAKA